jgi:hypothetical protein
LYAPSPPELISVAASSNACFATWQALKRENTNHQQLRLILRELAICAKQKRLYNNDMKSTMCPTCSITEKTSISNVYLKQRADPENFHKWGQIVNIYLLTITFVGYAIQISKCLMKLFVISGKGYEPDILIRLLLHFENGSILSGRPIQEVWKSRMVIF